MINVQIKPPNKSEVDPEGIIQAAQSVLDAHHQAEDTELTIIVSDDAQLHHLNQLFLGIDEPTDVLAFPTNQIDPDSENFYLGDIVISLERAKLQAEINQHPLIAELQLLVVHGVLHLLGYDHTVPQDKDKMWEIQEQILKRLVPSVKLPE